MTKKLESVVIVILLSHLGLGRVYNSTRVNYIGDNHAEREDRESKIGRIYQGQIAYPGQFKFMAFLKIHVMFDGEVHPFVCGATIIARSWVLTAAHCVDLAPNTAIAVYVGDSNVRGASATYILDRTKIFLHPGWNWTARKNDLALLSIPHIVICENVGWIKTPHTYPAPPNFENEAGIIMGWGQKGNTPSRADNLYWTTVSILNNSVCKEIVPGFDDNEICASTEWPNGAPCQGDSGGPLVLNGQLIGVLSAGADLNCESKPAAIFMKITSYYSWLTEVTGIVFV